MSKCHMCGGDGKHTRLCFFNGDIKVKLDKDRSENRKYSYKGKKAFRLDGNKIGENKQ